MIEQPTRCESMSALALVRAKSPVPIAADQAIFVPEDALNCVRHDAADLMVVGPHETAGITRMLKVAAIAEAAGININLHGLYESGITTHSHLQVAACISNLDDGNQ